MRIKLINHSSVVISCHGIAIWCDPWLKSRTFNESWSLLPPPTEYDYESNVDFDSIQYIWISHEHPDHFNIPTLKGLDQAFKDRVTVIFQKHASDKMFNAFKMLGFKNVIAISHREEVALGDGVSIYLYQQGQINSCLAVLDKESGDTCLNINDAELGRNDCKLIKKDVGKISVVLNQFSLAGYDGHVDRKTHLERHRMSILQNVVRNHADLDAEVTIPFASFIFFCCPDNAYMNEYATTPAQVFEYCCNNNTKMAVLYLGDVFDSSETYSKTDAAIAAWEREFKKVSLMTLQSSPAIELEKIETAFHNVHKQLQVEYPTVVLRFLKPVIVKISDLQCVVELSFCNGSIKHVALDRDPDLEINSQPLHFALSNPFGVQTLGVSARYIVHKDLQNWKRHRIIFAMHNAEIYLNPRLLFTAKNASYFIGRLRGSIDQLQLALKRM